MSDNTAHKARTSLGAKPMRIALVSLAASAAALVAACSENTPPPTPESQQDAAAASAPAGTAAQRPADGAPAISGDAATQAPTSDTQGHDSERQAPQIPR